MPGAADFANRAQVPLSQGVETVKSVPLTCHGHTRPITHLDFSCFTAQDEDQYYLISASKDTNPMLLDGVTGDWIGTFLGHKGAVWQARLSRCGTLSATASGDFTAKVWDATSGESVHEFSHNHIVRAVAFPSVLNPRTLVTGGAEKKLRVFDISRDSQYSNGSSGIKPADAAQSYEVGAGVHEGTIKSIVFAPNDPNLFVTAADDKKIRWWDLRTRRPIGEYGITGPVGTCEVDTISRNSPGGATSEDGILSVAADKSVYFFESVNRPGSLLKQHQLPREAGCVAANIRDGKFVTGGGSDTWIHVHDFETGQELQVAQGHHGPVWTVRFSPDGKLYATGSEDGTIKLWRFCKEPYGLWP